MIGSPCCRLVSRWAAPLALVASAVVPAAQAAPLEIKSKIERVTVYPDAALVTRGADIDVPPGATSLVLRGLPRLLDPASLRVTAEGTDALVITSVQARDIPPDTRPPDTAVDARLRDLRSQREGWQVTLDALETKQAMIRRFSASGPEKLGADTSPLDIDHWSAAWDTVGQGLAKVGDELRSARASARDLDDQIRALESNRPHPPSSGGADRLVSIDIDAKVAVKGHMRLTYKVSGASWRPLYDARLATGAKPSLELVRRAAVSQRTGEDWSGVALSVSTVQASVGTQAPDVGTERIAFVPDDIQPYAARKTMAPAGTARLDAQQEQANAPALAAAPPPAPVAATEQNATLETGAYQATFAIPGTLDVPADGSTRSVRIGSVSVNPDLTLKSAPALDPTAYLQVRFQNDEDAPLMAGEVSLERDGTMIGRGRIGLVAPGDTLTLGFGADDRVKVSRVPVRRKENEPTWFGQTKTETREFKTSVRNLHDFAVRVSLADRVPISETTAITVETLPTTTPPTDKTVDDRRGVMGWTLDLAPAETKDVRLAYRMKWPADRPIVFQSIGK